jgi:hypothetical protein
VGALTPPPFKKLIILIHNHCTGLDVDLHVFWVPRDQNKLTDALLKGHAYDHYSFTLTDQAYTKVNSHFGPHTIDRFASTFNVRVASGSFNSLYFEPAAEGLDAFAFNWRGDPAGTLANNWLHTPYHLIGRALCHTLVCNAQATLILPIWHFAHWWPLVQPWLHRFPHPPTWPLLHNLDVSPWF